VPAGNLEDLAWFAPIAGVQTWGYTLGMKTAISIPDKVFADAERLSHRLKKSRSQVYTEAVAEYIARHEPEAVTEAMNRVCEAIDTRSEPAISALAKRRLQATEW
jgi:metal-responsive CopG/Arc/MetJ family transcriptional regulator